MNNQSILSYPYFIQNDNFGSLKVFHAFFGRYGGISAEEEFNSLNVSNKFFEENDNAVKNQELILKYINDFLGSNTFDKLYFNKQIHSNLVYEYNEKSVFPSVIEADAIVTQLNGILIGTKTADCAPILLMDENGAWVSAIHAGWKGSISGIIENTIKKVLIEYKTNISKIKAVIGPMIQQQSYEIDLKFYETFISKNIQYKKYFKPSLNSTVHFLFNLEGFCFDILVENGIDKEKIHKMDIDTYTNNDKFFSYRKAFHRQKLNEVIKYGVQASVIGILPV